MVLTTPIQGLEIEIYQGFSLRRQAPVPAPAPVVKAPDPAAIAEDKAALLAETAERLTTRMNRAISVYNSQSDGAIHAKVEDYRTRFGDDLAERTGASLRLLKSNARQDLDEASTALKAAFTVTGQTHSYDPQADRFTRGPFIATAQVSGAAMAFNSETGALVSVMGGPFRADFRRPPQSDSDPGLSPAAAALFDIRA